MYCENFVKDFSIWVSIIYLWHEDKINHYACTNIQFSTFQVLFILTKEINFLSLSYFSHYLASTISVNQPVKNHIEEKKQSNWEERKKIWCVKFFLYWKLLAVSSILVCTYVNIYINLDNSFLYLILTLIDY